jgi:hypothetical protein
MGGQYIPKPAVGSIRERLSGHEPCATSDAMRRGRAFPNATAALAATLLALACGRERTEAPERVEAIEPGIDTVEGLDAVFADSRHGYRLSYPSDWTLADHSGTSHMIRADISRGKTAGLQIRVQARAAGSFEDRADRYARSFRDDMISHWGGSMEELDRGFLALGANRVFHVSFHARRKQGGEWLLVNYLVLHGDEAIVFQCGARFLERRSYEKLFEAVVASLDLAAPG